MIGVINYGLNNNKSVINALNFIGVPSSIINDYSQENGSFDKIILPGVGNFAAGMANLQNRGLDKFIIKNVSSGVPILGICLGLQLLCETSEEGNSTSGLGLISGNVRRLPQGIKYLGNKVKIPNVGYRGLVRSIPKPCIPIKIEDEFYFSHSYYLPRCQYTHYTCGFAEHNISAVINKNRIFGAQFHPEKSRSAGLSFLKAFCFTKYD